MFETKLIFKQEYRFDLRKVKSVLIPLVFNDSTLIISAIPKTKGQDKFSTCGKIEEQLIEFPNKLVASEHKIKLLKNVQYNFSGQGLFQIVFYPYQSIGKMEFSITRILGTTANDILE
ncbi:hypothetical protein WJM97_21930 [Okeanomitos corallinicola TIOX110]|uniref:Uncharacterized protein n=1 Tax=Okeanomitos corallinicola TIOX110 TaxID=3133117 RepID=A0ABZ2URH6_9CYAN